MAVTGPRRIPLRHAAPMALAICAALPRAQAEPPDQEHLVQTGDTLEALSSHYLGTPRLWPQLQAHNQVANPRRLRPGSVLRIPVRLLPMGSAQIAFVHGQGSVTLPTAGGGAALQAGQPLAEGARMQVAQNSFVTIRLADGTLIRVQADSEVRLQQLRRHGRAGDARSVLELHRGGVESSVPPGSGGARRLEIRTPKAATSVRGTRFAVALTDDERTLTSVTEGQVAVQPLTGDANTTAAAKVGAGQGVSTGADGQLGSVQSLLPAPDLSDLPGSVHDADFLRLGLKPLTSAVAYQVQLARDADFSQVVRAGRFSNTDVLVPALEDGDYHLSVRAIDGTGLPGRVARRTLTIKAHPVPPLYLTPTPGATISSTRGELSCTPVVGSAHYRIQVAGDAGFASPLLDETRAQHCGMQVTTLAPGHYYWRTASLRDLPGGGTDQGPFAPAQPFTVAHNPSAPSASSLQEGGDGPGLRLHWPGTAEQHFRLQLAASEDFAQPLLDERLSSPAWQSNNLVPGDYFVRLQTRAPSGLESAFSTPRRVRAQAPVQSGAGLPVTSSDGRPLARP